MHQETETDRQRQKNRATESERERESDSCWLIHVRLRWVTSKGLKFKKYVSNYIHEMVTQWKFNL